MVARQSVGDLPRGRLARYSRLPMALGRRRSAVSVIAGGFATMATRALKKIIDRSVSAGQSAGGLVEIPQVEDCGFPQ